jgi:predicted DNA-binding protein
MADTMQQVLVRLPREMYEQLKSQADSEDRTVAAEMRRAVRRHLEETATAS